MREKILKTILLSAVFSSVYAQEVLLKEIEVKAKREAFEDSLEVREVRESSAKDVGEALTKLSGVSKFRKGGIANEIVLRGFRRDNINVLIDDVRLHGACPNRMDPPEFHVDFSEVEKIEVIKGPFRANLFDNLFLLGGASYVQGRKDTNSNLNIRDKDVAEVPPLKARLGLRYDTDLWFVEGETIATATQNRVDSDLKEQKTSGYGILNLKAGVNYRNVSLTAGVDNVFDKKYYEHNSLVRNPFMIGDKVPEPGRTFYLNASYRF